MRKVQFSFRAVDIGFLKRNGKADGGVEELVVVGEVVHAAIEVVHVEPGSAEKALGEAKLVVISMRGFTGRRRTWSLSETTSGELESRMFSNSGV
jgi:hypothetical protein